VEALKEECNATWRPDDTLGETRQVLPSGGMEACRRRHREVPQRNDSTRYGSSDAAASEYSTGSSVHNITTPAGPATTTRHHRKVQSHFNVGVGGSTKYNTNAKILDRIE